MELANKLQLGAIHGQGAEPYGLSFNFSLPVGGEAGRYYRLGALSSYNDSLGALPWTESIGMRCRVQRRMRRCVMPDIIADAANPQNSVAYYLDPLDSTKKADGSAADLTGGDGQVMVEIPKFWQKVVYDVTNPDVMEWWISDRPMAGYTVHPAFQKLIGGVLVEVPYRYIGAYMGVLQDAEDNYLDYYDVDPEAAGYPYVRTIKTERQLRYAATPRLASVMGKLPIAQGTRAEFRAAARLRDKNTDDSTWRLTDWSLWSAVQLLFLVEYATFNSQAALAGDSTGGLSNLASGTWSASVSGGSSTYLPIVPTGGTEKLGNRSGKTLLAKLFGEGRGLPVYTGSANDFWTDAIPCYRGIESPFGNIWQLLDGIILDFATTNRLDAWVSAGAFTDDTPTDAYRKIIDHGGVDNVPASGYLSRIHEGAALDGFYSRAGGASNITGLTDYYYNTSSAGKRVVAVGGTSGYGGLAGVFSVYAYYGSGSRAPCYGGRLCL